MQKLQSLNQIQTKIYKVPLCPQNNEVTFICLNPNCQKKDQCFICDSKKCQICSKKVYHKKCLKNCYQSFLEFIKQKTQDNGPLYLTYQKIFDNLIDQISKIRDQCLNSLKNYGLSVEQNKFISSIQNGEFSSITSQLCFKIVKFMDQQSNQNSQQQANKLHQYWKEEQKKIIQSIQRIKNFRPSQLEKSSFSIHSKIITSVQQKINLLEMFKDFDKKLVKINLLYRASQQTFQVKNFHQKCDNKPNSLVLLQTQFGKKIGGFTPLSWSIDKNGKNQKDPSMKTFIFSLTNNHKFKLKNQNAVAIRHYNCSGPTFGGQDNSDLFINNNANKNSIHGNICNSFIHPQYQFKDQSSWTKFSGATSDMKFKAKQWEVYQVKFN